jgi:hypothetical protein
MIIILAIRWRYTVSLTPLLLYPVLTGQDIGWASEPVCALGRKDKSLSSAGYRTSISLLFNP